MNFLLASGIIAWSLFGVFIITITIMIIKQRKAEKPERIAKRKRDKTYWEYWNKKQGQ